MGKRSSATPGPYSGSHVIAVQPKGRRKEKSGRGHRREVGESYGRETSTESQVVRRSTGSESHRL